ncbi:SAM-dependent methyltransferase [Streptomyces manipurensis]|uniref:SAM-dependent methyltransferase n=1 Tax=Streptomyces manipurensis TaxID=1077945 RepID=UPI003C70617E
MTTVAPKSVDPEVDAIRHHYEVSNDFYRLLLGPTMMYSGGYWEDGEDLVATLDEAQERKLDKFAELAGVAAGRTRRVLDIGCGWGTMLNRLTTVHGAEQAVGLTLSRTQEAFIAGLDNPRITTLVQSWADYKVADDSEKYDAAFCINALEHFVSSNLPPKERTKRYRYFFQQVAGALNPGAKFVLHTMTAEALPMNRGLLDDLKSPVPFHSMASSPGTPAAFGVRGLPHPAPERAECGGGGSLRDRRDRQRARVVRDGLPGVAGAAGGAPGRGGGDGGRGGRLPFRALPGHLRVHARGQVLQQLPRHHHAPLGRPT